MWIYSSGFPKSQNVGKMIDSQILTGGAHTRNQRKMAMGEEYTEAGHYTVFSADKESELAQASKETKTPAQWQPKTELGEQYKGWGTALKPAHEPIALARKPIKSSIAKNCQQWGTGALNIDATRIPGETLTYPADGMNRVTFNQSEPDKWQGEMITNDQGRFPSNVIGEIPDYQKYFYCPKVSRKERHVGFDTEKGNNHPTVKPIELMKYLIKLVTPPGGTVLDPFNGSGSTGCAAVELGFNYVGIDLDPKYVEISQKRIEVWCKDEIQFNRLFER